MAQGVLCLHQCDESRRQDFAPSVGLRKLGCLFLLEIKVGASLFIFSRVQNESAEKKDCMSPLPTKVT